MYGFHSGKIQIFNVMSYISIHDFFKLVPHIYHLSIEN